MIPLIECVPNFSEGQNTEVIDKIAEAIRSIQGVHLLEIDPGYAANRTVMTFVGPPQLVVEAAFQAIKTAAQQIDMRQQQGVHPRMGATDVCPLIPIQGITADEANVYAQILAKRVGTELEIPVYLYEKSAIADHRKNLAAIRKGEYEGFREKIQLPEWKPDYGPDKFNEKAGQTVIGVRDFLIAYNINLNTKDPKKTARIARVVRESGYLKYLNGLKQYDSNGKPIRIKGKFKGLKAIGWYIEEYKLAQVSMNITDLAASPLHEIFEEVDQEARKLGLRVVGSELVGLIPLQALIDAGRFYFELQGESSEKSQTEILEMAIRSLGLNVLEPFEMNKKILEFAMQKSEG